jgi:hypothetical protein
MKLAKIALGVGGGIVVLIVLVVVIAFVSIDKIAKTGIEKGTAYALAVPTSLDSADVGVFDGTFKMQGLQINNPEGYDSPFFFRLESGGVEVSLDSLTSDVVTLPMLGLSDIDVHLDRANGKTNVSAILDNLKRFESDEPGDKPDDSGTKEKDAGKKFVVNKIVITNVTTHVHLLPLGGQLSTSKLIVPEIVLSDVGSAGDPVSLAELSNIITKAILASAADFGDGIIPSEILGDLELGLGELNSLAENGVEMLTTEVDKVLDDAQDKVDDVVDDLKDEADDAINKGLDSLFGDDDKDDGGG